MRAIWELLLDHQGDVYVFPLTALLAVVATYLIYWATNRNRYIKYIPGVVLVFIGLYSLSEGLPRITSAEGVDLINRFGIFFVSGFVALCFALILGVRSKYQRMKKNGGKYEKTNGVKKA
ncbi:MAG: hypothetical protein Q4G61_07115 [Tissierellia bacterium]|nr:hypothetical protein [Tissierellia bacterium]